MIESKHRISGRAVARHYDRLDAFYREIWGDHVHHGLWLRGSESHALAVRQLAELAAAEAAIGAGTQVIDIGCGYGATARLFAEKYGADVTGMTISAAQHAAAEKGAASHGQLRFILGDWIENGLADKSFEAAIAIESSEHMADKAKFFAEAHRVLRPGGRLVICTWLCAEHPGPNQVCWLIEPICRESRMPHIGSESEYRRLAGAAGFGIERVQDLTRQIARTWPMVGRTFAVKLLRQPSYLRFLCNRHAGNRIFAVTALRLWIAFRTGAVRYGVFTLRKSE